MTEKNENPQSVKEDTEAGKTQGAFWLQSLVTDAFHGKGFHIIEEYLQQKESHVPQKYNYLLLHYLDRSIIEELNKNEFQNCSLLLKCIQTLFRDDGSQEEPLLIHQGLIPKISGLISVSSVHMVSWLKTLTEFLLTKDLASDTLLTAVVGDFLNTTLIISRHSRKGTIQMLDSFILSLGFLVAEGTIKLSIQQEALSTLNCILDAAPWKERRELSSVEGTCSLMKELARMILTVGDYSQQVALSEALCRMAAGTLRNELAPQWFDDAILAEAFKEIKNREFETDCRRFLNFLNNRLGDERRVYSFPCLAAFAEDQEMRKPTDEKLEEFWIDFNLGSQSVTFYIDNRESSLWEPVQLLKEAVVKYIIVENDRMKLFIVYLREPIIISRKERKTIEIYFDRQFGISQASAQALGEDKETLVLINISPGLDKEDGEISSSHKRETEHVEESTILPESVDAEDNGCPITGSFNVQSESAIAFIPQDFFNYRKQHFFESNEDSASSERSWTQNSKRKSLRTYSQRRKLKVRSLRILPLSPVSSGRAPEKDQAEITPEWKDISRQNNTILPNFSEAKLQGSSVLLTPEVSTQKIELSSSPGGLSFSEHPKVEESIPQIMNRESLMENSSFKHKLEHSEHRGIPDESTTALKQSRLEDTPGSSAVSDVSISSQEDMPENANSSALKMALENFTSDLKRKFELKQKEIPLCSEKAKEVPGCLIRLWKQMYMCRLDKLQRFHSYVLWELSNLEKDLQAFECLEDDAQEFWKQQPADLQLFHDQQTLRFNSTQSSKESQSLAL